MAIPDVPARQTRRRGDRLRRRLDRAERWLLFHPRPPWRQRIISRLYYLIFKLDTAGVEMLSGQLSVFVGLNMMRSNISVGPQPYFWFGILALIGGIAKLGGCISEWRWLRYAGLFCGIFFWLTMGVSLVVRNPGSALWLALISLSGAQLWALVRLASEG